MKKERPYIGVTGFMTRKEVEVVEEVRPSGDREYYLQPFIMVGMLMSSKTLNGMQNKYPNKYPNRKVIASIYTLNSKALNIIHYSTDDVSGLLMQLLAMVGLIPPYDKQGFRRLHGFQLNIAWPNPALIGEFREVAENGDEYKLILQVGGNALDQVDNSPTKLIEKLRGYEGLVNYVLLDPSGGFGKLMDIGIIRDFVRAIYDAGLSANLGIAGGLSAETLLMIEPLIAEFPDLSIDAEGRLRDEQGNLDLEKVRAYIRKADEIYETYIM